uniref:DUF7627 domain-containing protein n=1 Tax=Meloidogyne javanica TaxID=6303 RepID=A0A915LTA9_MELJA
MSNERAKPRRSAETDSRDKRFLGSIQSILDPERSVSRPPRLNGTRKKSETFKECNNINDALESLNLSNSEKNNELEENNEINKNLFLKCVEGLATFCDSGQKSIWLNSPELFDDIYNVCFELLVNDLNNVVIPRGGGHEI